MNHNVLLQIDPFTRGVFAYDPLQVITQQTLVPFYEGYLPEHHPEVVKDMARVLSGQEDVDGALFAEAMALRSCQAVTMWNFLRTGGELKDVGVEEFLDRVWPAFDVGRTRNWLRAPMSQLVREQFGIQLASYAVRWNGEPLAEDTLPKMIAAGYLDEASAPYYVRHLHGKAVEEIVNEMPAVITIKNPVGSGVAHSVLAWDISDGMIRYHSTDERDPRDPNGLSELPVEHLQHAETQHGAVTVLIPSV